MYYIYPECILCNIFRNERGMKINEMAGGEGKKIIVTRVFLFFICVVCGVWCVVCGVWCVVCGVWCVVCGVWCVVCGVWCV